MKEKTILTLIALLAGFVNVWADDTPRNNDSWWNHSASNFPDYSSTTTFDIDTKYKLASVAGLVNSGYDFEGKTLNLTTDIDLSDYYWVPIGRTSNCPFKGTFNFNGKTVSRIYNNPNNPSITNDDPTNTDIGGLFGYIGEGGCVTGLKLEHSHLCGKNNVGGIAAYNNGTITDCIVESTVNVSATATNTSLGGIAAANGGTISGCVSSAVFSNTNSPNIGGLIGQKGNGVIKDCLYLGTLGSLSGGKVIGNTEDAYATNNNMCPIRVNNVSQNNVIEANTISNGSTAVTINYLDQTTEYPQTGIKAFVKGLWYDNVYYYPESGGGGSINFTVSTHTTGYKVQEVRLKHDYNLNNVLEAQNGIYTILSGGYVYPLTIVSTVVLESGAGISGNPYTIETEDDWDDFVRLVNAGYSFSGEYVKLENNIQFGKWEWQAYNETGPKSMLVGTPDHPFKGTFLGNDKRLTFDISGQVCYIAPFRFIDGATIQDLIIDGMIMNSQTKYDYGRYTAGLVANASGNCEIRNCVVMGTVQSAIQSTWSSSKGGFIANISSGRTDMSGCVFIGNIYSNGTHNGVGGLVGYVKSEAGLSLQACLFAPMNNTSGTANGCRTLARSNSTSTVTINNCLYTNALGEAEGTPCVVTTDPDAFTGEPVNYGFIKWYADKGICYSYNDDNGNYYNSYYKIAEETSSDNIELSNGNVNSGALALYKGQTKNVTITGRKLNAGKWNTLCLPFDVSADQIANETNPLYKAEIRELDFTNSYDAAGVIDNNVDDDYYTHYDDWEEKLYLYFKQTTEIKAGKPYIVKPKSLIENPTFNNVQIARSSAFIESGDVGVFFVGNFDPAPLEKGNTFNLYLGSDDKLYYPGTENFKVNAFRAYFLVDSSDAGASESDDVRSIYLNFGDDEPSVVRDIDNGQWKTDNVVYDLNGRKVNVPLKKGLYIRNGRKVVIK